MRTIDELIDNMKRYKKALDEGDRLGAFIISLEGRNFDNYLEQLAEKEAGRELRAQESKRFNKSLKKSKRRYDGTLETLDRIEGTLARIQDKLEELETKR